MDDRHMPSKLEAVLGRIIERVGPIDKMKAVKLPYLIDVISNRALGRTITGGTHQAWRKGVVTKEVYDNLSHDKLFIVTPVPYSEEGWKISLRGQAPTLDADEEEIVDLVAEWFGRMSSPKLGKITKRMNPEIGHWGSNQPARVDEEAYLRIGRQWQNLMDNLEKHDTDDESQWGKPIDDPSEFVKAMFNA